MFLPADARQTSGIPTCSPIGSKQAGFSRVPMERADVVVLNACSLTVRAESDARRFIRKVREVNPAALVALVGCHAQAYPERDFGADLVLGQAEKFEILRHLPERGRFVGAGAPFPDREGRDRRPEGPDQIFLQNTGRVQQILQLLHRPFR